MMVGKFTPFAASIHVIVPLGSTATATGDAMSYMGPHRAHEDVAGRDA